MIVEIAAAEAAVTPAEALAFENYIQFLDDLNLATRQGFALLEAEAAMARSVSAGMAGVLGGFAVFIIFEIIAADEAATEARNSLVRSQRRRKRTAICGSMCNQILTTAGEGIRNKKFDGRPLESSDEEKRKQRQFKSRA